MPARISLREFCQRVVESGLMTAEEVIEFRKRYPSENRPATADAMARELVYAQKLTPFQAGRLIDGQQRSLILGNNVLLEKIGEGGMGEVYKALHRRMRRLVCVKILRSSLVKSDSALKRFHREVQAAAQLSHPNIVTAFDADESGGTYFLVMEFVEGVDLGTLVSRNGPLAVRDAVRYVAQAARGLEYAHAKGIVHRDIKPGNLLLEANGTVKILDMGLARFDEAVEVEQAGSGGDGQKRESLTKENQIVGTVEYMSPEQADDSGRVDRRSDIYSLGCTLFRLLTGGAPYHADSPLKVLMAHRLREIPSLTAVRPDVPPTLDAVFRRMVAKSPAERFQTMAEVLEALRPVMDETDFEVGVLPPRPATKRDRSLELTPTRTMTIAPETPANGSDSATEALLDGVVPASLGQPAAIKPSTSAQAPSANPSLNPNPPAAPLPGRSSKRVAPPAARHAAVGIDLGTTYSVVACLDEQGHPHALPNSEGDVITPSVVLFDADEVVVGKEALKALSVDAELVAECAKRELGGRSFHQAFRGRQYPPEVIEAHILNKLRQDAGRVIGEVRDAVITVPAYFDENRRKATQDAGYMAGLRVLDIINEPTAAALAFGFHRGYFAQNAQPPQTQRILVYDLGGGTFDVTVMEIRGVEFHTLATDGDVQLGGRDWDQRLLDYVAEQFVRTHRLDPREDLNTLGRLRRDCDEAKRTLSARQKTHVVCDYRGFSLRVEISRALFQELTYDLLERTSFTTRMAMQAAHLDWKELDRVLLVGGATRMPAVPEMLRKLTGAVPDNSLAPDEAVALGAALHAGLIVAREKGEPQAFSIRNVNSHSLGVVGTDAKTGRKQNAVLIPRNTPLPAVAKRVFKTHKPGQTSLLLQIVEGESSSPDECAKIGRCSIRGLPPDLPAQTPLDVRFHYAENGRITVSVHLPGQTEPLEQEITRENSLTQRELDEWRTEVGKRK